MKPKKIGKKIANSILRRVGYEIINSSSISHENYATSGEREFLDMYDKCKDYTFVPLDASFALYNAVKYISRNKIPGDFVECGVWKGGQAMIMAYTLLKEGDTERQIYLYDTYKGMSEPTEVDVYIPNREAARVNWEKRIQSDHNAWSYASLENVKANLISTGYPKERISFIEGKVEETIPHKIPPHKISLLRLDTDWYESTYHELTYLYPLLERMGVLIIDDYGVWAGSRKAMDSYMQENNLKLLFHKIGLGARIAVKS